jgi:regulator of protease activity HflC (stomatin/prohibitin superfamily)
MSENDYLQQVMANQQRVEVDLKARRMSPAGHAATPQSLGSPVADVRAARMTVALADHDGMGSVVSAPEVGTPAVDVRITGWGRWRTVIVPPNAHVVHTRRGHARPLHIGLGVSFSYNPSKDSFLVVPGTMQTIMINAYCICRELQGLLVQGYVQWIIADFATAYKKLDFTDVDDPMRVVNAQLREQAEAAIKDKVATMGIDEVLSDKQPIIEELTARLRSVAEGEGGSDTGLGLRIVTVQVKEAVVSSKRVWENLQKPFRAERARVARLAELEAETVVAARERVAERDREAAQLASDAELAGLRAATEAQTYDRDSAEAARRVLREQETQRQAAQLRHDTALATAELDKVRIARDAEVAALRTREAAAAARLEAEHALALDDLRRAAANRQAEAELRFHEARQRIVNEISPAALQARLIEALPLVAERLPKPTELRAISIGNAVGAHDGQALTSLIAQVLGILDSRATRDARPDRDDVKKLS